nr:MAG TPA: hypothetical protein [Caudoviricetes sp.]
MISTKKHAILGSVGSRLCVNCENRTSQKITRVKPSYFLSLS